MKMTIGTNLIDYDIQGLSEEDSLWPTENLLNFEKRSRWWKTTTSGDNYVVIDMTSATQLKAVAVIDTNYTSCKIQGNATDVWTSPSFDSGTLTIYKERITDLYRLIYVDLLTFNYRYLRLFIPTQARTDGASVFRTGVLAVTTSSKELIRGIDWGMRIGRRQAKLTQDLYGGGLDKAITGYPYATFSFDVTRPRNQTEFAGHFTETANHFLSTGEDELMLFSLGDGFVEDTNHGQYIYIVRQDSEPEIEIQPAIDKMSVNLREAI